MSEGVAVDTNIWEYAYVEEIGLADRDALHREALEFVKALLADASRALFMSQYQIIEILEVLRRVRVARDVRLRLYHLFCSPKCRIIIYSEELVREAHMLSSESGIHIFDYMMALPLRGHISTIYTADSHFEHGDFGSIASIANPLSWTMTEKRGPRRRGLV